MQGGVGSPDQKRPLRMPLRLGCGACPVSLSSSCDSAPRVPPTAAPPGAPASSRGATGRPSDVGGVRGSVADARYEGRDASWEIAAPAAMLFFMPLRFGMGFGACAADDAADEPASEPPREAAGEEGASEAPPHEGACDAPRCAPAPACSKPETMEPTLLRSNAIGDPIWEEALAESRRSPSRAAALPGPFFGAGGGCDAPGGGASCWSAEDGAPNIDDRSSSFTRPWRCGVAGIDAGGCDERSRDTSSALVVSVERGVLGVRGVSGRS
mmetsp:Transcript_4545/g.10410  ORF Transcript_4545/g.10410 Transcript_4545/m.10410 type:complete len:269 (-) Transcript_4545:251-1057(-)